MDGNVEQELQKIYSGHRRILTTLLRLERKIDDMLARMATKEDVSVSGNPPREL